MNEKNINITKKIRKKPTPFRKDISDCNTKYKIVTTSNVKYLETFNYVIRLKMYKIVTELIPSNILNPICLDDLIDNNILKDILSPIGKGTFGTVSVVSPKCTDFSIVNKESKLNSKDFVKFKKGILEEITILLALSKSVLDNTIQNFPILYSATYCETDTSKNISRTYNLFMEKFDGTLKDIFENEPSDELLENLLLQCILAVASAQHIFGLFHTDIKSINFLYKYIKPGGYWKYNFRGDTYYVKNLGYIAIYNDFGIAKFLRPKYSIKNSNNIKEYGNRPIHILDDKIEIIKYKYHVRYSKRQFIYKDKGFDINYSIANNKFDLIPDREIDLENLDEFPPTEFIYDNIDILRMFCGGRRTLQEGKHYGTNIERYQELINLSKINLDIRKLVKQNILYIFSGKMLLKILFPEMKKIRKSFIDIFTIN